jgi:hypothetical protein
MLHDAEVLTLKTSQRALKRFKVGHRYQSQPVTLSVNGRGANTHKVEDSQPGARLGT